MERQLKVGDVVRLLALEDSDTTFFNEPKNCLGYVYETYNVFYERGVSVITENGVDLGWFSAYEQRESLVYVSSLNFWYQFRSEQLLERDWQSGAFAPFMDEVMKIRKKMGHAENRQQKNRTRLLELFPEGQMEDRARLLTLGNAVYKYHRHAEELEPTEKDFNEWLEGIPKKVRRDMEVLGFDLCRGVLSFSRYVLEKNDIGMDQWMEQNLSEGDYSVYCEITRSRDDGKNI